MKNKNISDEFDLNASIERIQSDTSMSFEDKRFLISMLCINKNVNSDNPLIDRYPINLTSIQGNTMQKIMLNLINYFRKYSGLRNIYGGYVQLKEPLNFDTNIGMTSLIGMNIDSISNDLQSGKNIALCYIAIPIDEWDYLVENPSIDDWGFQESIVDPYLGCSTVSVGAFSLKHIQGKLRTLKWSWDIDS